MGECVLLCILGLLLFGSQLPRMAHTLGSTAAQIRKGVRQLEGEV
jgi:Sec-independent protein translocase protein TatA